MAGFQSFANIALFIFWGVFIAGFFFAIVWILKNTKKDIIETNENNLRLGLFFLTIVTQSFFVFLYAASLYFSHEYKIESYIQVFAFFLAMFPLIYLLYSYLGMSHHFIKKFKLFRVHPQVTRDKFQPIEIEVKNVSEKLGLKRNPVILFSEYSNISPFVFGKTVKRSYFVLPRNWEEILEKVGDKNFTIMEHLRKFVFRHELSHIKHKDHIFVGLSFLFLKSFKYWISATVLYLLVYSNINGLRSVKYYSLPLFFTLFFYGIFWLLSRSLSKQRELLADARVSAVAKKEELETITTRKENGKTYVESLLNWFYVFSKHKTYAIGISRSPTRFSSILNYISDKLILLGINKKSIMKFWEIFFTHPENQFRIKKINESDLLSDKTIVISIDLAIWIGIITSYFSIVPYLFSYEFIILIQDIRFTSLFGGTGISDFFSSFTAIYISLLIYMPLIAATNLKTSYIKYLFFTIERILIANAVSVVVHFILAALRMVSKPFSVNLTSWLKGTLGDALVYVNVYLKVLFMISIISAAKFFWKRGD